MEARNRIAVALLFLCGISCPATASFSAPAVVPKSPQPPAQGIQTEVIGAAVTIVHMIAPDALPVQRGAKAPTVHIVQRRLNAVAEAGAALRPGAVQTYHVVSFE